MGLYDRDYLREDRPRFAWNDLALVTQLVIVNLALFVVNYVTLGEGPGLGFFGQMALKADLFAKPWQFWQLLTYGFAHEPRNLGHVGFNMLGLWFFGREVEVVYGRREFLRIYLVLLVVSGLVWLIIEQTAWGTRGVQNAVPPLVGASGGVMGILTLFALHFPRRLIYVWGVLPVPAWMLCLFYVAMDLTNALGKSDTMVAHTAHLGGALFGLMYYQFGWNFGRLLPGRGFWSRLGRPRLRVHREDQEDVPADMNREVDRILEKISRSGEASLTTKERRTLEEASRRYQRRRR
jgi:membrane associated rhomboid family serine protease